MSDKSMLNIMKRVSQSSNVARSETMFSFFLVRVDALRKPESEAEIRGMN